MVESVRSGGDSWEEGGCHCGRIRFRVRWTNHQALECNCSICAMKGFINIIVEADDFVLLRGAESITTYRFNTMQAEHCFCRHCGIHPFSRPRSHPGGYDVNGRCLDRGIEALETLAFDGRNWEDNVDTIR